MRMAALKEHLPGLLDETTANFFSVNKNRMELKYVKNIPRLVLSRDYDGTASQEKVSLTVSRVGYDGSKTQAVVEVGTLWAPLVGGETLYFLEIENGEWKIRALSMTWIS